MLLLDKKPEFMAEYEEFLQTHQAQLESSNVPQIFWETLYEKLRNETLDAGEVFQLALYENPENDTLLPEKKLIVSASEGINANDEQHIYLIDHAWVYEANNAKRFLNQVPQLLTRMCDLMGYCNDEDKNEVEDKKQRVNFVLQNMWKYNNTFSFNVGDVEERLPLWYIMDEVGCAISHSDEPNFRAVPFMYLSRGVTYSLIFPMKDLEFQEEVTRDFVEGMTNDSEVRRALLLPWIPSDFIDDKFDLVEPDDSYYLNGRTKESYPEKESEITEPLSAKPKIKVYSQYVCVEEYLVDPQFEITKDKTEADILWLISHFNEFKELSEEAPGVYINQFPCENVLTVKDLFSLTCRRAAKDKQHDPETLETFPAWFPTTFNLTTELVQFVSYFQKREAKGLENHWICKPWNLARGLDMHITDNLAHILRLPCSGPKIAQKYLSNPVLFSRPEIGQVKFDIRYVVLLNSAQPLRAHVYSNFFLRFANKAFALDNFDDYEQHFTVMNYDDAVQLCHMKCDDFILEWNKQYSDFEWKSRVEPRILDVLKEVLEAAVSSPPPKGIAQCRQSRAMYAVDLMLEWRHNDLQPVLLEFNFIPDCQRACEYYPDFFNDVFQCLFLDNNKKGVFHDLSSR